jgi:PTH1 family peptidyl-tRNA hydrolase
VGGQKAALLKPMQFMNLSGQALQQAAKFFQIPPAEVIVIHDELDLELSMIRLKQGGGAAGHNGLRSIIDCLGTPDFLRVRVGIGKGRGGKGADHVLSDFAKFERAELPAVIATAADATEAIVRQGLIPAMNQYNRKDPTPRP